VPPAIQGLGFVGGFQMQVQDREGVGPEVLQERAQAVAMAAGKRPEIDPVRTVSTFRAGVPQIYLQINREKAEQMGVKVDDIFNTLQASLGSVYVNDFNKFGRTYQVRVQADARFRGDTEAIRRLEVPGRDSNVNPDGTPRMGPRPRVPLGTLLDTEIVLGPQSITRYNLYPAAQIPGLAKQGVSSTEAINVMEDVAAKELPPTMGYEWTGLSYQEKRVSGEAFSMFGKPITESYVVFALAVLLVYLVLAALYESWLLPFAVILVVPLGLLGVVAAVNLRAWLHSNYPTTINGMDNNIYTQIGVVLIIALASKNAILIVEFARELRLAGRPIHDAALEAARMRFRPIIMTSFAFILGVLPLVFATGAGAASRQSLGTAVCGGMLTSTVLAVFFVPVFYVAIQSLIELISGPPKPPPDDFHPPRERDKHESKPAAATATAHVPVLTNGPTENGQPSEDGKAVPENGKPVEVEKSATEVK